MITVLYISNQGGGAPKSLLNMIHALKPWVNPIVLFENDWYDYQAFVKEGIECIIVPYRMNMVLNAPSYKTIKWKVHRLIDEYYRNRLAAKRVKKQLQGRKIDIVHTNTGAITIGVQVAKVLGAKHVWHLREFQDIDFGGHPYCGWKKFYQLMRKSDAVIGITYAIAQHFSFEKLRNAHVVWDAVRSSKDACYDEVKENYILYCSATIAPAKGLHDLIDAYAQTSLPYKGIQLKVLGGMDSSYWPLIESKIREHKLEDKIIFEGGQDNVKSYFTKALAFVLPSLNEGMGRVVVEAMFYGCPVIVRAAGGPLEYIQHGENGYLFNDTKELSALLIKVCFSCQKDVEKYAQTFALANFSEEIYGMRIMKIYKSIL